MRAGRLLRTGYLLLVLGACAAAGGLASTRSTTSDASRLATAVEAVTFRREVAPFPILDENGKPYDLPFLGGMDVPRPQFLDIDADGDLDLFLQVYPGELWYFENTGSAAAHRYEWRTDKYNDLSIGEWFRFVDLDADGDFDLLSEEPYSYVRYYRNAGTPRVARFEQADSLRDEDGKAMFIDRQNIPALVDLDCDKHLDFFVGRVEGILARFEATSPGAITFALQNERFEGIEIIGQVDTTGTMRHGANTLAFADFDGDGDLDLFWGDFFERGVLLIENIGRTCSTPNFTAEPYELPYADSVRTSGYNAPAPVDFDGDGDLDFFMGVIGGAYNPLRTAANNFYYWERLAPDHLELRTTRFLSGLDLGNESVPAVADIDGDGDLDIVVGTRIHPESQNGGRLYVLKNEGTRRAPRFQLADTLMLTSAYSQAPAFGDLDADGDIDMLVGTWNSGVLWFRNDGNAGEPRWVMDSTRTISPSRATNTTPALFDVDADGDLDLFVGEAAGEINFFRNVGDARNPRFELESDKLGDVDVGRRSSVAFVDTDGDGVREMVVGREEREFAVYRIQGGSGTLTLEPVTALLTTPHPMAAPVFVDLDGDGLVDLISGTAGGGLLFYRGTPR